ncbi:ComEA family DNA-binding protein [Vibrio cholerae]|uniref:ComEA family DNA-binding protein n=1 Tax=Vibrio paracholerae TaxID=650003 RepID=UPI000DE34C0E|nr:ComEA family DNA-binding protein [Vibrio paracholerae]ELJ8548366.1 ComEA family DNA-binding protein [Vibrio cholerae]ELY5188154.1 ComEA family DNA-binding protein [Vibrio cholerae]ELY5288488.1 ComEA family DNA-binding protein [Vibrio cholerae]RBM76423.1 ComEA family DNA-binding protein [Vibrio paracholerae]
MQIKTKVVTLLLSLCLPTLPLLANAEETAPAAQVEEGIVITVNINTASAEELATLLKGIGLKKAQAIVDYREANGHFSHIDDLTNVKGIGEATVRNNATRILL